MYDMSLAVARVESLMAKDSTDGTSQEAYRRTWKEAVRDARLNYNE
jgi:hypothetical protein